MIRIFYILQNSISFFEGFKVFTMNFFSSWTGILGFIFDFVKSPKKFLTILSSREWKVIIANIPSFFKNSIESLRTVSIDSNSLLTAILIAWKTVLAGFFKLIILAGKLLLIMSTNSNVVLIGLFSTMAFAIFLVGRSWILRFRHNRDIALCV